MGLIDQQAPMNRQEFEQLVCQWLDEPGRDDLRLAVQAAVASHPQFSDLLEEWRRLDWLLRTGMGMLPAVNWNRLKERITTAIREPVGEADRSDETLDAVLRSLPNLDRRVDWSRLHRRITGSITRSEGQAAARRRLYVRVVAPATALLATAASLLLAWLPNVRPAVRPTGLAVALVGRPTGDTQAGVATAMVARLEGNLSSERFFMVDPVPSAEPLDELSGLY